MKRNIDKRTWGVLGKQHTFYSPSQYLEGKTKVPLNANPFESWDSKRSRFNRIDGVENVQQGGVIPQDTTPQPTPTNTPTPSITPSLTPTNTPTASSVIIPSNCIWDTSDINWNENTNTWDVCEQILPSPTPTSTETPTPTPTQTETPTNTPTPTQTETPTNTPTPTSTETPTPTPSVSPTSSETPTPTPTQTETPTNTPTPSITPTQTQTGTPTPTPSATPAPFVPSSLSNLQYWFDAGSGFTPSSWTNYGLLGGAVTQGTAIRQPQSVSTTFGTWTGNTVQFLGANREFMTGSFTSTNFSAFTHFVIGFIDGGSTSTANITYDMVSGGSVNNRVWFKAGNSSSQARVITGNRIYNINRPSSGIYLLELSGTNITNGVDVYSNDVLVSSAATATTPNNLVTNFNISYDPGSAYTMDMRIAEILVYNRVLTPTEFQQVEDYLKTKYQYSTW